MSNNGHTARPHILIEFGDDGQPILKLAGINPALLTIAAKWLERLANLHVDNQLVQQLQAQGPRVVVPR